MPSKNTKKDIKSNKKKEPISVQRYVRYILMHIDENNQWKKPWTSEKIANKYGLTKGQVAAVKSNNTMGKYKQPAR